MTETDDPIIPITFDRTLRKPACVILQAVMGGNSSVAGRLFTANSWLVNPTPDMKTYRAPLSEWKRVAKIVNDENPLPKLFGD